VLCAAVAMFARCHVETRQRALQFPLPLDEPQPKSLEDVSIRCPPRAEPTRVYIPDG
jgi:hypothetical protein